MPEFLGSKVASLRPLQQAGRKLIQRLQRQAHGGWDSVPVEERIAYREIDAWFAACLRTIEETFGSDSAQVRTWSSAIGNFDTSQRNRIKVSPGNIFELNMEIISFGINILDQLEAERLALESSATDKLDQLIDQLGAGGLSGNNIVNIQGDMVGGTIIQSSEKDRRARVSQMFTPAYDALEMERGLSDARKNSVRELLKNLEDQMSHGTVDRLRLRRILIALRQNAGWLAPAIMKILTLFMGR